MFLEGVLVCLFHENRECFSTLLQTLEIPTFPKRQIQVNQSKSADTAQPCTDTELFADLDLAWDYTPGLDLTFLVFFECKHAHRPTCRGLTPLLKKKRADPMLTDPNLPRLPLPTVTFLCSRSLFLYFHSHFSLTHTHFIWRGNLHLWLSPYITAPPPSSQWSGSAEF